MKKVLALIGVENKANTCRAVDEFERNLKALGEIEFETLFLSDLDLRFCRGCKLCFDKGEDECPCKDDRDFMIKKFEESDGVIFAAASYAFQVPARMKNLFDRLSFLFHRPRFFGKVCTAILTRGMPVAGGVRKYMETSGENMGFSPVKGCSLWTLVGDGGNMNDKQIKQFNARIKAAAERFYKALTHKENKRPSLFRVMLFRLNRSALQTAGYRGYDYDYFERKGWFKSDYYYDVNMGAGKKLLGRLFELVGRSMGKNI